MTLRPTSTPRRTRRATTLLAGGVLGVLGVVGASSAWADTIVAAQTSDPGGDAHGALQRNVPTADLLRAGVRFSATQVTFFVDLATAPTQADLTSSHFRYDETISFNGHPQVVTIVSAGGRSEIVANPGSDDSQLIQGSPVVDQSANEITFTVDRAEFQGNIDPLAPGTTVQVTAVNASALSGTGLFAYTGKDSAAPGPVITLG
ncbi:hypothetical protein [Nocardioides rubriscoriae]|uniref:hypothetical protein n=1 Tax=Nocardioides rubriscoriae TaxID=642762 RepID=UPI001478BF35|nr:hypothetical protein [Nocardioides rubriscoriae]